MKVTISNYGTYPSKNPNTQLVTIGDLEIFFSYETPVAFRTSAEFVIRENVWGPTTGKHLNMISPDKSRRVPGDVFEAKLAEIAARLGLEVA